MRPSLTIRIPNPLFWMNPFAVQEHMDAKREVEEQRLADEDRERRIALFHEQFMELEVDVPIQRHSGPPFPAKKPERRPEEMVLVPWRAVRHGP